MSLLLTPENVEGLKPENYVHLLVEQRMTFEFIKDKIESFSVEEEVKQKALQRLDFAVERIDKSLTLEELVTFFFFPYGVVTYLVGNSLFDVKEQRRLGYVNRVKQFQYISIIGFGTYFLVGLLIIYFY